MPFSRIIWYYLWIAPHVLLMGVIGVMFWKKLFKQFPIFFTYAICTTLKFFVLFILSERTTTTGEAYFRAYSFGLAIVTALRFGVIYEIFVHLFGKYAALGRFGKPVFRWATVILLLAASILAAYGGGNNT